MYFIVILTINIKSETKAAPSTTICAWKRFIINERGLFCAVAKKETAEIVIIEFTKKYENIYKIVDFIWGSKTSRTNSVFPIPKV